MRAGNELALVGPHFIRSKIAISCSVLTGLLSHLFCDRAVRNSVSSAASSTGVPIVPPGFRRVAARSRRNHALGRYVPKYGISVGGAAYSAELAFFNAATPSSNVISGVVFTALTAPPSRPLRHARPRNRRLHRW